MCKEVVAAHFKVLYQDLLRDSEEIEGKLQQSDQ